MPSRPEMPTPLKQRNILYGVLGVIILILGVAGWIYATTPKTIARAAPDHFHLRLQIILNGQLEDFSAGRYQTASGKDICTAKLTSEPFHFHDGKDQFLHVHWAGMTGGILLKNYGWNLIGGPDGYLGLQDSPAKRLVPIHGLALPVVATGEGYYIYTGNDQSFKQNDRNQFLRNDLSGFMNGQSTHLSRIFDMLATTAHAQSGDDPALAKLNDFRGNIVIFVQKTPPNDQQIKDRFARLQPLPTSACSG